MCKIQIGYYEDVVLVLCAFSVQRYASKDGWDGLRPNIPGQNGSGPFLVGDLLDLPNKDEWGHWMTMEIFGNSEHWKITQFTYSYL